MHANALRSISVLFALVELTCTAQWAKGPKSSCSDLLSQRITGDTLWVRKDLHDTRSRKKVYGAIHALGWSANPSGLYPTSRFDLSKARTTTTDTCFKKGNRKLVSGTFQFYYRKGVLKREFIFKEGFMLSDKNYFKDGSLASWIDYDIDLNNCLFSCFVQQCSAGSEQRVIQELFQIPVNGRLKFLKPEEAWGERNNTPSTKAAP